MGRKNKPDEIKRLAGNPGQRKILPKAQEAKPAKVPPMPTHLRQNKEAAAIWKRSAEGLWSIGLLRKSDVDAFAAYCLHYALWQRSMQIVNKEGSTFTQETKYGESTRAHPELKAAMDHYSAWSKLSMRFGLAPSDRIAADEDRKDTDPLSSMTSRHGGKIVNGPGAKAG